MLVDAEWVQLNPEANIWLDVAQLEDPFLRVRHIPGAKLDDAESIALREAVQVYQADLLEGWYQDWCIYERERLRTIYLAMLDKLLAFAEDRGRHDDGLAYGEQILRHDRAHERTHQRLMRLNYLAGDRTAAIRQFERCATALREELGVTPAERTVALYEEIRADQRSRVVASEIRSSRSAESTSHRTPAFRREEAVGTLRLTLRTLDDVKELVENSLQAVERL